MDKQLDKEYAGILGNKIFQKAATELVVGTESDMSQVQVQPASICVHNINGFPLEYSDCSNSWRYFISQSDC